MIVIDEYLALRVLLAQWPERLPGDELALPTSRHWRLLQALHGGRGVSSPKSPSYPNRTGRPFGIPTQSPPDPRPPALLDDGRPSPPVMAAPAG